MTRLGTLMLDRNDLEALNQEMFSGLVSLEELNLARNSLTTLPNTVFNLIHRPLTVVLGDNPMKCNSELCWLKDKERQGDIRYSGNYYISQSEPTCASRSHWYTCSCNETGIWSFNFYFHTVRFP